MASSQRGKPVQILSINDDYSWRLEYDELSRILLHESIKDKPVVVVSIAGAYRQGKSFLMNFFMRYMRNEGTDNWLGDPRLPLEGFEWKHGSRRLTTGILLWDEVFLATTSDGQEVAVLFMDTQGLFDGESTNEESATLFALSVLTSSVQIYNILHNIRDDQLEHLEFFTQYGQLAQKEVKGCPFQRLVILVRDSNKGTYGAEAGQALLEERLECTKHSRPENQRLRRSIRAHFPDMECFLMPYPGNEVAAGESYDGRLSVVDKKFRKHLRELVPWILAPERLVVKQMNGEKVSCKELLTYIKAYVQAFKSGKLPEPKSLLQATAEANHLTAKDKAAKAYMTMMSNLPRGDLEKLQGMHAEALAKAKKVFDDTPKIGGDQMSKAYLDRLTNELQGNFNRLYDEEQAWLQEQQEIENRRLAKEAEKDKKKRMEFVKKLKETKAWAEKKWKKEKEKCEERLKHEFESKLSKANRESKQKQAQLEAAQKEKEELEKKNKRLLIATVATGIFCGATMGATSFAATAGGAAAKVASVVKVAAPMAVTLATNIATSSNKK